MTPGRIVPCSPGRGRLYTALPDQYSMAMIVPLEKLVNEESNIYELTRASIRRAYQITVTGDEELEANEGKVVSTAIKQILTRQVQYQLEE